MNRRLSLIAAIGLGLVAAGAAQAQRGPVIGVSWSNFQEERWKTDETAIKAAVERAGGTYISADAQSSPAKQLTDVESLISRGAKALIILAQDADAIRPAVEKAANEGVPVVAYDRLIEIPSAFYVTFDNVEVGRLQARAVLAAVPKGNYVFIKGSSADPNATFLYNGAMEVLKPAFDRGDIKNVGEAFTDGWLPANAQRNMEQFLTRNNNQVNAVIAANDGTGGGAIAALAAQGLAGTVAVSGQDADRAALNRVALGTQTVSVFKDSRLLGRTAAETAIALASGKKLTEIPGTTTFRDGPRKVAMTTILLTPVAVTRANLNAVVDSGWIPKDALCQGVPAGRTPICG